MTFACSRVLIWIFGPVLVSIGREMLTYLNFGGGFVFDEKLLCSNLQVEMIACQVAGIKVVTGKS